MVCVVSRWLKGYSRLHLNDSQMFSTLIYSENKYEGRQSRSQKNRNKDYWSYETLEITSKRKKRMFDSAHATRSTRTQSTRILLIFYTCITIETRNEREKYIYKSFQMLRFVIWIWSSSGGELQTANKHFNTSSYPFVFARYILLQTWHIKVSRLIITPTNHDAGLSSVFWINVY